MCPPCVRHLPATPGLDGGSPTACCRPAAACWASRSCSEACWTPGRHARGPGRRRRPQLLPTQPLPGLWTQRACQVGPLLLGHCRNCWCTSAAAAAKLTPGSSRSHCAPLHDNCCSAACCVLYAGFCAALVPAAAWPLRPSLRHTRRAPSPRRPTPPRQRPRRLPLPQRCPHLPGGDEPGADLPAAEQVSSACQGEQVTWWV
jgi:hypothetical protein